MERNFPTAALILAKGEFHALPRLGRSASVTIAGVGGHNRALEAAYLLSHQVFRNSRPYRLRRPRTVSMSSRVHNLDDYGVLTVFSELVPLSRVHEAEG